MIVAHAYCNDCQTTHLPDQHAERRRRSGGRHLAPRNKNNPLERVVEAATSITIPPAEELGERTARILSRFGRSAQNWSQKVQRIGSEAAAAAPDLLRTTWDKAVEFSGVANPPSRHARPGREPAIKRKGTATEGPASMSVSSIGVGVMEYATTREPLMEVSMLESFGFYDPDNTVVVQVSSPLPPAAPLLSTAAPTRPAVSPQAVQDIHPLLPLHGSGVQLIPDLELPGWKPHVIARSKLGARSFRLTTVGIATLIGLSAIILIIGSVRQPRSETLRVEEELLTEANSLASSLGALDTALAATSTGQIEATTPLIEVETSARGLFEVASEIDADDQAELRSITTDISRQALDLKNRVTEALSYRVVLAPFWHTPDLSAVTDPSEAASALAPWQAQIAELVTALPATAELGEHAQAVEAFAAEFPIWAETYLDALVKEDTATADQQLVILEASLAQLAQAEESMLTGMIEGARRQVATLIAELTRLVAGLESP